MLTNPRNHSVVLLLGAFLLAGMAFAQPTYKLDVKPHLKPLATLTIKDGRLTRTAIADDPGFRLQYHFKKEGKSVTVVEARGAAILPVPQKIPGAYSVTLELFYPGYTGGSGQKGQFKTVSNEVHFRVEAGARPSDPVKVVVVEPAKAALAAGKPALAIQCGKAGGKLQDEIVSAGFGYKLIQGVPFDGWPKTAARTHCWADSKLVRFDLTVPPGKPVTVRLLFVDGDGLKRKQRVSLQGKDRGDFEGFATPGKKLEVALSAADTQTGKIEVAVTNLNPAANAVVSTVEVIPLPR